MFKTVLDALCPLDEAVTSKSNRKRRNSKSFSKPGSGSKSDRKDSEHVKSNKEQRKRRPKNSTKQETRIKRSVSAPNVFAGEPILPQPPILQPTPFRLESPAVSSIINSPVYSSTNLSASTTEPFKSPTPSTL